MASGSIGLGSGKDTLLHVVSTEMPADLETPVSAYLRLQNCGARILLESVESGTILGRYSFIGIMPESKISMGNESLIITDSGGNQTTISYARPEAALDALRDIFHKITVAASTSRPPLLGGMVGYISYDMIRLFENISDSKDDRIPVPQALFYFINTLVVFDHVQRRLKIITLSTEGDDNEARSRLDEIRGRLQTPLILLPRTNGNVAVPLISNFTREEFCEAVVQIKEFIARGDVYQLVLSQRLRGSTGADPFMIYRALRMLNPSPYMFYLDFDSLKLIGSSPEALVKLENGIATVRPIAGTRPRGHDEEEDQNLAKQLISDEKERAEHVMLVDLGRNDLGRCCEVGSVKVTDFMNVEKYSHVMHMTSNVVGRLRAGLDQFDLFRAAFPAGTVTGAPKIRAMQLIDELETTLRGPYAGAVGYFGLSGDMDWCISIRTIVWNNGEYFLQAGAGIVADSVPEREYQETIDKITALKRAIEIAEEEF